jgi:hypothetical protein
VGHIVDPKLPYRYGPRNILQNYQYGERINYRTGMVNETHHHITDMVTRKITVPVIILLIPVMLSEFTDNNAEIIPLQELYDNFGLQYRYR